MPANYRRGQPPDFDPTRKLKETLAWIVLCIAVIIIGIFAFQVMLKPSAKEANSSKESNQAEQKTEKSEEEKKETKEQETSKKEPEGIGKIRVIVDDLNMRSSPETKKNNRIASLPEGTELTVLSERGNWYEVVNKDGVKGYVSSSSEYVEVISMKR